MYKFAIIEDVPETNNMFKGFLQKIWSDCDVQQFLTTESALAALDSVDFDLVVSDIEMGPGSDKFGGLKVAKALDAKTCPLLIVSGSANPEMSRDMFRALDAWDYLQKPVTEADFALQVKRGIAFRMARDVSETVAEAQATRTVRDGDLVIDRNARKNPVTFKGKTVPLTMTHICLLELLALTPDQPVSFDRLFQEIASGKNKQTLRMHMSAIRAQFKSIDLEFNGMQSVPMIGYRWRA
jgi:DNA-binding response OmpR family regulator